MKFVIHKAESEAQWERYRQLELLPESVPNPANASNPLTSSLNPLWRSLLALLIDELVAEQRVEYLDRCWSLNAWGERDQSSPHSLHRLWTLME